MDTLAKLNILSADSQYDLACACGTGKEDRRRRGLEGNWLYPVPLTMGGYGIMLKTLFSNVCSNDCKYCPLRSETDVRRCSLTPEETAAFFMDIQRKRGLIGIFLSSGVLGNPDVTMDKLTATAAILRRHYKYRGYIHLKVIPGCSREAILTAMSLASAVSLNIETPGRKYFEKLSHCKDFDRDIVAPLKFMSEQSGKGMPHARVKCTTQFIVGASDESDLEIVRYMDGIYRRLHFERVYFSAYQPGLGAADIPGERRFELSPEARFTREHRLYQTDFLMRAYGFSQDELIFDGRGNLDLEKDPKQLWADMHPEEFPVNINRADRERLLRVPGIGPATAEKIIKHRKERAIRSMAELGREGKLARKASAYLIFE